MPTLTRLDKRRVTFKTITEEQPASELVTIPFLLIGLYGFASTPSNLLKVLLFIPFIGFALFLNAVVLGARLRSERLVIDLRRRTYHGRRGPFFWSERLRGSLDDFDHMRLVDARSEQNTEGAVWALEFVWRKGRTSRFA